MNETANNPKGTSRRAFLGKSVAVGAGTIGAGLLSGGLPAFAQSVAGAGTLSSSSITKGDVAILRFLSAAEIIETDLWQQYNELGGIADSEVPGGTPDKRYINAVQTLDTDMPQYIHDNTEDEMSHFLFINAVLENVVVLRILLSIGPTEAMHFQTWHDKAGNAKPLSVTIDGQPLTFPDFTPDSTSPDVKSNLIMPEQTIFLSRSLPTVSIVRPTNTQGAAMAAARALIADGLFTGQHPDFFAALIELAEAADAAQRGS